jgi:hypothetical protein
MMISAAKNAGTTIGGTNHDAEVSELSSVVLLGKDLEVPPSSSRRALAARGGLFGDFLLIWVMMFKWSGWAPMTRAYHEHVPEPATAGAKREGTGPPGRAQRLSSYARI